MTVMFPLFFGIPQSSIRADKLRPLSGAACKLYIVLWHESEYRSNREFTLTSREITSFVGLHRNSIRKAQRELVNAGLARIEPFGSDGSIYTLCDPETSAPWPGPSNVQIKYKPREPGGKVRGRANDDRISRTRPSSRISGVEFPFGENRKLSFDASEGQPASTSCTTPKWDEIGN